MNRPFCLGKKKKLDFSDNLFFKNRDFVAAFEIDKYQIFDNLF